MTRYGYHASHEQFRPGELLRYVRMAEKAGFESAMCSDHIAPWSTRQGQSGFAWSWLGSALEATQLSFGVVTSPVGRYNPAVIAQAAATLADMYPGRFWLAVGSGLFANEHITGEPWPPKEARNRRLLDAALVMRRLWQGETVSHDGHFRLDQARLYTLPEVRPHLIGAAITPDTAEFVAGWADGLITIAQDREQLAQVVDAFRNAGGRGKPVFLQAQTSWAEDEDAARENAYDQWRGNIFPSSVLAELRTPEAFDAAAEFVTPDQLEGHIRISADVDQHVRWLREDAEMGFSEVLVHNVGRNQEAFIGAFGERVLPAVRQRRAA
jgi:coenzyme F420-dependent glucose-6-phosphate dehydrogenase